MPIFVGMVEHQHQALRSSSGNGWAKGLFGPMMADGVVYLSASKTDAVRDIATWFAAPTFDLCARSVFVRPTRTLAILRTRIQQKLKFTTYFLMRQ